MVNIVLADDHHLVRQGLRALLEANSDFAIVGEASNGLDAVDLVTRTRPDVLIVDLMMPGLNGLEVTRKIHQQIPDVRVIILSMHADESYVLQALTNGARAYILKESTSSDLTQAIHAVLSGGRYLSAPLSDRVIETYLQQGQSAAITDPYNELTAREREILQLVAEGHTNTKIAELLSISSRTVEVHRTNMMRKLNLHSKADVIRYALRRGILPSEPKKLL